MGKLPARSNACIEGSHLNISMGRSGDKTRMTNREGMSGVLSVSPTVTYLHSTVCFHTPAQTTGTPSQTEDLPRTCLHTWLQGVGTEGTLSSRGSLLSSPWGSAA